MDETTDEPGKGSTGGSVRSAVLLGCNADETEFLELLLDVLGWRISTATALASLPDTACDLALLSINNGRIAPGLSAKNDVADAIEQIQARWPACDIVLIADEAESLSNSDVVSSETTHLLLRPIKVIDVETLLLNLHQKRM